MKKCKYNLKEKVWIYPGVSAAWHFVYVDKKHSEEIKKNYGKIAKGFGSLPVKVIIGKTEWNTSIFPDSKNGTYLLPLKSQVRKKERIFDGDNIKFNVEILIQ